MGLRILCLPITVPLVLILAVMWAGIGLFDSIFELVWPKPDLKEL